MNAPEIYPASSDIAAESRQDAFLFYPALSALDYNSIRPKPSPKSAPPVKVSENEAFTIDQLLTDYYAKKQKSAIQETVQGAFKEKPALIIERNNHEELTKIADHLKCTNELEQKSMYTTVG